MGFDILSGCGGERVRKVRHARRERSGTGNWTTGQRRGNSADNPIIQGKLQDMGKYEENRARAQFMYDREKFNNRRTAQKVKSGEN